MDSSGLTHSADERAARNPHGSLLHTFSLPLSTGSQAIRLHLLSEPPVSYLRFPPGPPRKMMPSAFCCPSRGPLLSAAAWMPPRGTLPVALLLWAKKDAQPSFPERLPCSSSIHQHQAPCLGGKVPGMVLHPERTFLGEIQRQSCINGSLATESPVLTHRGLLTGGRRPALHLAEVSSTSQKS